MPKTLVVPVDGSPGGERAMRVATKLATHLGSCDLRVVTVLASDDPDRESYLHALVEPSTELDAQFEMIQDADPAGAIARMVHSMPDAAVCMATHARGRLAAPFIGSVATEVLRLVTAPVVLVGPRCRDEWWRTPAKLVTCWDGEASNAILPWARQWADDLGIELWLECVFHPLDTEMAANPRGQLEPAIAQLGPDVDIHLLPLRDTLPATAIVRSARDLPATLIAMNTRARRGATRAALGSVAMEVVHRSPCPVLVVRG